MRWYVAVILILLAALLLDAGLLAYSMYVLLGLLLLTRFLARSWINNLSAERAVGPARRGGSVSLGGSPRVSITLFRTAQAFAAIGGRNFVLPDDVKRMVQPVLGHRLILRPESRLRKVTPAALLHEIVGDVRVPVPSERPPENDHYE